MILDNLLSFGITQNLAQVTGTYTSLNSLDLHVAATGLPVLANLQGARDLGIGDDPALKLLVQVTTTFTSGGAGTLQVKFQGATDNGSGAANAFSDWWVSPAYALATLVQGARLMDMDMPRPPAGIAVPRFLQLSYVIGGATMTAGQVSAFLVLDRMDQMYLSTSNAVMGGYPAGITVAN
jgi:hypothetical protein